MSEDTLGAGLLGPSVNHFYVGYADLTHPFPEVSKHLAGCQQRRGWAILKI